MKKLILTFCAAFLLLSSFAQTGTFSNLQAYRNFRLNGKTITGIADDSTMVGNSHVSVPTEWAVYNFVTNRLANLSIQTGQTFVISSQAAMLALSANVGDVASRSDTALSFILQATPASTLSNWIQLRSPGSVPSVFGRTGVVTAQSGDYSAYYSPLVHTHAATDITSGTINTARLGSGTANSFSFLRGDNTWSAPPAQALGNVLSAGNSASNSLTILGNPIVSANADHIRVAQLNTTTLGGVLSLQNINAQAVNIHADYMDSSFELQMPIHRRNATTYFMPLSVNNQLPDSTGNITIIAGGSNNVDSLGSHPAAYYATASSVSGKVNNSDTASMLSPYAKTSAVNLKVNIADTASMLSTYAKTSVVNTKVNISDTASMLSPYAKTVAVNGKLNISDSAAMLNPYLRKTDTTGKWISPAVAAATYATITNLALKVNISDTASMLSHYLRAITATSTYLALAGGTITGDIIPSSAAARSLGSSSFGFLNTYTYQVVSPAGLTLQSISSPMQFKLGGTVYGQIMTGGAGNLLLQNGGTFTDNGNRLQVSGDIYSSGVVKTGIDTLEIKANVRTGLAGKQPLENQRLSTTNDVQFGKVFATTLVGIRDSVNTNKYSYVYSNAAAPSIANVFFLPSRALDTLVGKQDLINYSRKTDTFNIKTDKYLKAINDTVIKASTVYYIASASTHTFNVDSEAVYIVTAQASSCTFANPAGSTPNARDKFEIEIKDNGTAQALSWGTVWANTDQFSYPTTTIVGKKIIVYAEWDDIDAKMYIINKITH